MSKKPVLVFTIKSRDCVRNGVKYAGEVLKGHQACILPGESIRLFGLNHNHADGPMPFDLTFKVGDEAVYGSYNYIYTGKIIAIGANSVTIRNAEENRNVRLDICTFSRRNHTFDAKKIEKMNASTADGI